MSRQEEWDTGGLDRRRGPGSCPQLPRHGSGELGRARCIGMYAERLRMHRDRFTRHRGDFAPFHKPPNALDDQAGDRRAIRNPTPATQQIRARNFAHEQHTKAPEGAATGAGTGGVLGGGLGWLVGIGALAIPGVGPFIAAGPIMAALAGAAVGAAAGGRAG